MPLRARGAGLVVGDALGEVPDGDADGPAAADLDAPAAPAAAQARGAARRRSTLDLRARHDRERSAAAAPPDLLEVPLGRAPADARGTGTFKEAWRLEWQPELALALIDAGPLGHDGRDAPRRAKARRRPPGSSESIAELAALVEAVLLADLPEALGDVLHALADPPRSTATPPPDGRRPAARPHPPLRRRPRQRHERRSAGVAARDRPAQRGRAAGAGVGARRGRRRAAPSSSTASTRARAAGTTTRLTRAWRAALRARRRRRAPARARSPAGPPACCSTPALASPDDRRRDCRCALVARRGPRARRRLDRGLPRHGRGLLLSTTRSCCACSTSWVAERAAGAFDDLLPLLRRAFASSPPGERRRLGERLRRAGRPPGPWNGSPRSGVDRSRRRAGPPVLRGSWGSDVSDERLRRWRLVLGGGEADGRACARPARTAGVDAALDALYDDADRRAGRRAAPRVGALARRHPHVLPERRSCR